jgi:hypothetical protein
MANILEDVKDYGLNLFEDAKDWAVKKGTDMYIDNLKQDYVDSVVEAFGGPKTITPEMANEGWKYGLDGVPYNSSIAMFPEDFETDSNVTPRPGNTGPDFAANNTATTSSPFLSQDLRQRTPSGTIYNPSMEAFENASLFDYQGPGGLAEYTYGQGLPMGYGIYGTPVGPNLYYEGQFGEGYREPQVADNAINLPPVTMPGGIPQIPTERPTQANMPGFTSGGGGTGPGGKDLTYQETIDYFGLDPASTTFPSPGAKLVDTPASVLNVGLPDFLSDAWTGVKDFGSDLIGGLFADDGVEETSAAPSGGSGIKYVDSSGIKYVDMGNNPDVGNLYTDPADRKLANEILGGEAYARAVYNNDPIAQAIPGMADKNIAGFNLGRPQTKAQREMMSNVPDMFKVEAPSIFAEPGGPPASTTGNTYVGSNSGGQYGGGVVRAGLLKDGPINRSTASYATQDTKTNEVVTVNPVTNTVTHTGMYGPPNNRFR